MDRVFIWLANLIGSVLPCTGLSEQHIAHFLPFLRITCASRAPTPLTHDNFPFSRVVIVEFSSVQAARDWYESEEYAAAKALRLEISKGEAVLVAGVS